MRFAWLLLLAAACDDGWHEGDPVDRAFTSWAIVPSLDEQRVSMTLEPRRIHRLEHGVLTLGYSTQLAGPSIGVELATGEPLATYATGATTTVVGATRAWVLQSTVDHWDHTFPVDDPPRAAYVSAAVVDRATLAATAPAALAVPIDQPVAVGDELFDLPSPGTSDTERDLAVRRRALDGTVDVVHAGRGFGAAWCVRDDGLVLAYQLAGGDLRVVAVQQRAATIATFPATRFDPSAIACNATASHAALVVTDGIAVFDVAGARVAVTAPGTRPPFAVRGDGTAIVATRAADRALVFADATGVAPTGLIAHKDAPDAVVSGDLAVFQLDDELRVVDLVDGRPRAALPRLGPRPDYFFPFYVRAWPAGRAFVIEQSQWVTGEYAEHASKLVVLDATRGDELPLPADLIHPSLSQIRGGRVFLRGQPAGGASVIYGFELATRTRVVEAPVPLCDEQAVLEERGCR